jgi:hypothetical protein
MEFDPKVIYSILIPTQDEELLLADDKNREISMKVLFAMVMVHPANVFSPIDIDS